MITLQCLLEFQNKQDKEIVSDLIRRFSSAMRYAYKRLLEGKKRKDLNRHKSWRFLSIALAFCCLEKSYRDFSPLKRVIISKDWIAVANRLVPMLGIGTTSMPRFMILPKYRLLGLGVSEMAEYKYPNSSCTER
ncbi:MAG: hypothetical protein RXN95_02370 [Hydrogenobaculum sp.]